MIILIGGSSHTGKTRLAQKLLEKYQYPYLSIDHLLIDKEYDIELLIKNIVVGNYER